MRFKAFCMFSGANPCLNTLKAIGRQGNGFICYDTSRVKLRNIFLFSVCFILKFKGANKKINSRCRFLVIF